VGQSYPHITIREDPGIGFQPSGNAIQSGVNRRAVLVFFD